MTVPLRNATIIGIEPRYSSASTRGKARCFQRRRGQAWRGNLATPARGRSRATEKSARHLMSAQRRPRTFSAVSEAKDVEDAVGRDGDELVPVDGERDRIGADGTTGLKIPQRLSGARV